MDKTAIARSVLAVVFFFVIGSSQLSAATFTVLTGALVQSPTGCNFKLEGEIQPGDLAKLSAARAQVRRLISERLGNDASMAAQWASNSPVLCLNSPGGNFSEGLRMAKFLMEDFEGMVTTYVMNDAECYSACGLIFLAGKFVDRGGETYPSRSLHVGGRLGFHAPYIDPAKLDDQRYSRREIADAFKAAISSVTDAIELFDQRTSGGLGVNEDNRPWVNASLFVEMLRKGADELFVIDTVGKAGRWGIALVGVKEVNVLNSKAAFQRACDNAYSWEHDLKGFPGNDQLFAPVPPSEPIFRTLKNMKGVALFQFQRVRTSDYCAVKPADSSTPKVENLIVKMGLPTGAPYLDGYQVPLWAAAFNSRTPLRNLLGR